MHSKYDLALSTDLAACRDALHAGAIPLLLKQSEAQLTDTRCRATLSVRQPNRVRQIGFSGLKKEKL